MLVDRLIFVAIVLAVIVIVPLALRAYGVIRARRADTADLALGTPMVLYFSTEECVQCRLQQAPALDHLRARVGDRVAIRNIDALAEADLTNRFGVLTVPTTIILDGAGTVRAVNLGFAPAEQLAEQVARSQLAA